MSEPTNLRIEGPLPRWGPDVALVTTTGPPGRLAMVFGPPVVDPAAMLELERHAGPVVNLESPGLLPLRRIDEVKGRVGFGYEVPDGASVAALTRARPVLPAPTAAALLHPVVHTLCDLGAAACHHPGPTSADVLVDLAGAVDLAGLGGPGRGAVESTEPALVGRLGALLATWLGGRPWARAATSASHEALLRRLLLDVAGRPGPAFEPAYRALLRGLLAWEPTDRPRLGEVLDVLRSVSAGPMGEPLDRWVRHGWRSIDRDGPSSAEIRKPADDTDPTTDSLEPMPMALDRPTQPTDDEAIPPDHGDEDTAVAHRTDPSMSFAQLEQGAIPVRLGPPPEAVPQARLPEGFLAEAGAGPPARRRAQVGTAPGWLVAVSAAFVLVSGLALVVALVLSSS